MTELREQVKDISSESQRFFDDAQERAAEIYSLSKDFVRENQTLVMVGAGVTIGLVGFLLGRASKSD
jgi:ElaB/YqjD/DUF883 family membrane-anchored ribosome-binding protein